jgi:hypothetical protein
MARRRYRSDALSTAVQSERPRDPAADESLAQPIEPRSEYGKAPPEPSAEAKPGYDASGLKAQIDAMRQPAQQQWQQPQQQHTQLAQLHGYIDSIPNLSAAQRQWLHYNPHGVYRFDLLHAGHTEALERGVPADSGEYFRYLADKLNRYFHAPPQQPAQAPPPPVPPPEPVHAAHVDIETHDHEPEEPPMTHYAAPVSRGTDYAIEPERSPSQIRLTPEERELCRVNQIDETKYAEGKLKLAKLKASGLK